MEKFNYFLSLPRSRGLLQDSPHAKDTGTEGEIKQESGVPTPRNSSMLQPTSTTGMGEQAEKG